MFRMVFLQPRFKCFYPHAVLYRVALMLSPCACWRCMGLPCLRLHMIIRSCVWISTRAFGCVSVICAFACTHSAPIPKQMGEVLLLFVLHKPISCRNLLLVKQQDKIKGFSIRGGKKQPLKLAMLQLLSDSTQHGFNWPDNRSIQTPSSLLSQDTCDGHVMSIFAIYPCWTWYLLSATLKKAHFPITSSYFTEKPPSWCMFTNHCLCVSLWYAYDVFNLLSKFYSVELGSFHSLDWTQITPHFCIFKTSFLRMNFLPLFRTKTSCS